MICKLGLIKENFLDCIRKELYNNKTQIRKNMSNAHNNKPKMSFFE